MFRSLFLAAGVSLLLESPAEARDIRAAVKEWDLYGCFNISERDVWCTGEKLGSVHFVQRWAKWKKDFQSLKNLKLNNTRSDLTPALQITGQLAFVWGFCSCKNQFCNQDLSSLPRNSHKHSAITHSLTNASIKMTQKARHKGKVTQHKHVRCGCLTLRLWSRSHSSDDGHRFWVNAKHYCARISRFR